MRIKIIGENNCARATRHLLRLAGFAVAEYLPADAVAGGPLAGYAITIDLAPALHTPDALLRPDPPRTTTTPQLARKRLGRIGTLPLPPSRKFRRACQNLEKLRQFILIRWTVRWRRLCCGM